MCMKSVLQCYFWRSTDFRNAEFLFRSWWISKSSFNCLWKWDACYNFDRTVLDEHFFPSRAFSVLHLGRDRRVGLSCILEGRRLVCLEISTIFVLSLWILGKPVGRQSVRFSLSFTFPVPDLKMFLNSYKRPILLIPFHFHFYSRQYFTNQIKGCNYMANSYVQTPTAHQKGLHVLGCALGGELQCEICCTWC